MQYSDVNCDRKQGYEGEINVRQAVCFHNKLNMIDIHVFVGPVLFIKRTLSDVPGLHSLLLPALVVLTMSKQVANS